MTSSSTRQVFVSLANVFFLIGTSLAAQESLGSPSDHETQAILQQCLSNATLSENYNPAPGFGFGKCPQLINCILGSSTEATKAGMSAGTGVAALIPTMLALIGAGPSELVRLAFISPLRGLATCLFGVGLPSNLFEQLQRDPSHSSTTTVDFPASIHRGVIMFAFPMTVPRSRRTVIIRLALEVLILALAAIMLWRNWRVGTMTMVTWRCEYRWLLFFWPVACVVWWVAAVGSLIGMARKVDVLRESDKAPMPWRALLLMSYTALRKQNTTTMSSGIDARHTDGKSNDGSYIQANPIPSTLPDTGNNDDDTLIVRLELPSEAHLRWWNTAVQAVAVGIYLYATFVLSSVLFLTGQEAILYAVGMTLSLSAIRIMTALL